MKESPRPSSIGRWLSDPARSEQVRQWLAGVGVRDTERAETDLRDLARRSGSPETMESLVEQLGGPLSRSPDPGMALRNLERYIAACPDPGTTLAELAISPRTTEVALQLFGTSQYFSEMLIREPTLLGWLRRGAQRRDRSGLAEDLWAELRDIGDEARERLVLRRFRRRELLRIGFNDIVRGVPLEVTTLDLSHLADSCVECAYRLARRRAAAKHGEALAHDGTPMRFVVLALGKLGGTELNYSSDIDLIFLYEGEGQTAGPRAASFAEYFARLGGDLVRVLSDHTELGVGYRVDMRLRPDGDQGILARSLASTLDYYVNSGRTWERQALLKCRAVAGDLDLGERFIGAIGPFVYRRYLGATEIAEIKAMKRRIEARTISAGEATLEVKTGHGGIRDVEFVVQFLQLLHGGQLPGMRESNTLIAISKLEEVGCLTAEERGIMDDTYRFLRQIEHRLQTMFDRQTHRMPTAPEEARTLAIRMGYPPLNSWEDRLGPSERFQSDYRAKTELNRRILNHLLHDAFRDDDAGAEVDPVVDLVLDPRPTPEQITATLARYPFRDSTLAYQNLMALAREDFLFLSQARCRHFLAAIAPRLLRAVAETPDPDMTLNNLEKVSASLGAKAMLWELFNYNPPTLRMYVEICATSQLLSEILTSNPGMIDDLMDSLVVDRTQTAKAIKGELAELCRGAQDLAPILVGFRNKEWVRIGTRDVLGRESIRDVTRELSDVAEAILSQVARDQWDQRAAKHGEPRTKEGNKDRWAIVAMGKFGGRELNYRSDLDLVFLNEADGRTHGKAVVPIDNDLFLTEVVRRLIKELADPASPGPLYVVDPRLRPHGGSGALVLTLASFRDYFAEQAKPWERLALTKARVVYSSGDFGKKVAETIQETLMAPIDVGVLNHEALAMRRRLQESREPGDLKRGPGGLADVDFVVQYLQIVHAREHPEILKQNTWDALDALRKAGLLARGDHSSLRDAYEFLRAVESRLRIVRNRSSTGWPQKDEELSRLARRLPLIEGDARNSVEAFRALAQSHATRARGVFERLLGPLGIEGN